MAAWLGLVPRQHSTGGRARLLGISKRGDVYLRQLLIHGARAVLRWVERKDDPTSRWAAGLKGRRHPNVAVVALANKIARIAHAGMTTGQPYDPPWGLWPTADIGSVRGTEAPWTTHEGRSSSDTHHELRRVNLTVMAGKTRFAFPKT